MHVHSFYCHGEFAILANARCSHDSIVRCRVCLFYGKWLGASWLEG